MKLKSAILIGLGFAAFASNIASGTVLISPTGDGGFETGTDFPTNGWTVVNGLNNRWFVGSAPGTSAGARCAFTGLNGTTWSGEAVANVNHFYRNVTFPSGETNITLTFKYKLSVIDATFDYLKVFLVPTSTTPVAGTQLGSGQIGTTYDSATSYTTVSITVAASNAGTTQRLVFSWRTDGASPNAAVAVDEISLTSVAPIPLHGTKTIGPTGDYGTLTAAFADLGSRGVDGATILQLQSTYTSSGETFPVTLNTVSGAGATNTITITPTTTATISGPSSSSIIKLNGADFVTIDGSNSAGSDRSLTINNTSTSSNTAAIWLASLGTAAGATNDAIKNCNLTTGSVSATTFGVFLGGATISNTGTGADNDNVTVQNNSITTVNYGIYASGTAGVSAGGLDGLSITSNLIGPASSGATNTGFAGIYLANAVSPSITGNTIRNLTTSTTSGTGGIYVSAAVNGGSISQNILTNLSSSGTVSTITAFSGIYLGTSVTATTVSRNKLSGIFNSNTSGYGVVGILINTSSATSSDTIVNNLVWDISSYSDPSTDYWPSGIAVLGTSAGINIYFNSVNLFGSHPGLTSGTGAASFFMNTSAITPNLDLRDNVLSNSYNNSSSSTDKAYAIYSANSASAFTQINYNDYFASGTGSPVLGFLGSDKTTLNAWQSATGKDGNSKSVDPVFTSTTDLHLQATSTLLGMGQTLTGVTIDIDGDTRDNPPDIGADEIPTPVGPGVLQFSSTTYSGNEGTTATITVTRNAGTTGAVSVNYATNNGSGAIGGASCNGSTDYVSSSGTLNFADGVSSQTFTVSLCSDAVTDPGETIILTLSNPTGGASIGANNPATLTIIDVPPPLSGNINVGSSQTFTTLTAAINALNSRGVSGPTTFLLTDATYSTSETFPIVINAIPGASATNTITIKPASAQNPTISGSATLLKLNGADYITIDGSNNGSSTRNLSLVNNDTGTTSAAIWIASASASDGATNDTVKNCIMAGNAGTTTVAAVLSGSGTTFGNPADAPNSNNTIQNNQVTKFQNAFFLSGEATTLDQNWIVSGNIIGSTLASDKMGFRGLLIQNAQNFSVDHNAIAGVTTASTSTATGIGVSGTITGGSVAANSISDIKNTNTSEWGAIGLWLFASSTASNVTVTNNVIYDVAGQGYNNGTATTDNGYGIYLSGGGGYKLYFNSVRLTTNQADGGIPAAINISGVTTSASIDLRDNVFATTQTSGTRYAIYSGSAASVYSDINYNDYYPGTGILGFLGSDETTITSWRSATGKDAQSLSVDPVFISTTNLHIVNAAAPVANKGTPISGITTDFDGDARNTTAPYIGADELVPSIATAGTLSPVDTTYGTASASPTSFSVSGANLSTALLVTPPSQFEVATALAGPYSASLSFTPTNGTVSSTTVYLRLKSTTDAGSYSGNVGCSNTYAPTVNVPIPSSTVSQKELTISGLTGNSKVYDRTTSATFTGTASLNGVVNGDSISLGGTPAASFADFNVGTNKPITVAGYTISGTKSTNYFLTQPTLSGNITPKDLFVTANSGQFKIKGDSDPVFGYMQTGLISPDTISGALSRVPGEAAGSYGITQGSLSGGGNYMINFTSANFVIAGPLAASDEATRPSGAYSFKIPVANLTGNDTRIATDGTSHTDNLSITGVASGSGNTVSLCGAFVCYTPDNPSDATDKTFTYTLLDSSTSTNDTGTVTVHTAGAQSFSLDIIDIPAPPSYDGTNTSATVDFVSVPNQNLLIEYSTNLTTWTSAGTYPSSNGSFSVTITAVGDHVSEWNAGLFFRATQQ